MNLLQKTERVIRAAQLVFWGAVAGLILGTVIGTLVTRYWYTSLARPGPAAQDGSTARVVISPPAAPGAGEEAAKSVTERQRIQITVKGHAKGPAKLAQSATRPQEVPIETRECTITSGETIGGPDPRILSPGKAENWPSSTVGGTVIDASSGTDPSSGGQAAGEKQPAEPEPAAAGGEPLTESAATPPAAFRVGDRAEGTVTGKIEVVDTAGRPVTTEPLTITGDYTLDFPGPGLADLDLRFTAPAVLAVETPVQAAKNRAVYLSASAGWLADRPFAAFSAGYARRWPLLANLSAQAEIEAGWVWTVGRDGPFVRVTAGIEYRFQ